MRDTGPGKFRVIATAASAIFAMALAGCSSDEASLRPPGLNAPDEVKEQGDDLLDKISEAAKKAGADDSDADDVEDMVDDGDGSGDDDGSGDEDGSGSIDAGKVHPLVWRVPAAGATPAGFKQMPTGCEAPEAKNTAKLKWISYGVPETWSVASRSSGSDSPLGDTTTMSYYEGEGNSHKDYVIEFDTDRFQPDQESPNGWTMINYDKEPWKTFDYESKRGDKVYTIHFDSVASATVGEQKVEIFKAPQKQAPEALSKTEYRARVVLAETPTAPAYQKGQEPPWIPQSSVISIKYNADSDRVEPLTDELVADIISSIAMPECAMDYVVAMKEYNLKADVDGDGHVTTQQEMVAVMKGTG